MVAKIFFLTLPSLFSCTFDLCDIVSIVSDGEATSENEAEVGATSQTQGEQ